MLFKDKVLANILGWIINKAITLIGLSCKITEITGKEYLDKILKTGESTIFSFWHNTIFYNSHFLHWYIFRKKIHLTILISSSKDGEFIAKAVEFWGGSTARGSTTRGGGAAMVQLLRQLRKPYNATITTPDGPKGPVHKVQIGTITLAQLSKAPVVTIHSSYSKYWTFKSWDKFMIPKPFAKIKVNISKPFYVNESATNLEASRQELENIMLENMKNH